MPEPVTIKSIRAIPLYGKPYGDWPHRFGELEQTSTLVDVVTNNGIVALGSVYTWGRQHFSQKRSPPSVAKEAENATRATLSPE
jgi:hypothetical protein